MGLFVILKVAGIYGQWVTIEDPDGPGGYSRQVCLYTIHASHLVLFDEPCIDP